MSKVFNISDWQKANSVIIRILKNNLDMFHNFAYAQILNAIQETGEINTKTNELRFICRNRTFILDKTQYYINDISYG